MSEIRVDKISGKTSANAVTVTGENGSTQTSLQQGLVKAWAEITGSGTAAINDSFNMSSLDDNATGDYDANFTNVLNSDSFSIQFQAIVGTGGYVGNCWALTDDKTTSNTGRCQFGYRQSSAGTGAAVDPNPHGWWTINGDLA